MFSLKRVDDKSEMPVILLNPIYKDRSNLADPMKPTGYKTGTFLAGAIIERCGRRYILEPDGSQRLIPDCDRAQQKAAR